jgi:hypothetical protein
MCKYKIVFKKVSIDSLEIGDRCYYVGQDARGDLKVIGVEVKDFGGKIGLWDTSGYVHYSEHVYVLEKE